jgi:hypothetical protein
MPDLSARFSSSMDVIRLTKAPVCGIFPDRFPSHPEADVSRWGKAGDLKAPDGRAGG